MEEKKAKFELTPQQRMNLLLHEFAFSQQERKTSTKHVYTQEQIEAKNKEYFEKFPFDEKAIRDFLTCKKELGYFKKFDVTIAELSEMLQCPDCRHGFRIINVTVGKGMHDTKMVGNKKYEVNENEVYITYNTQSMLSGGIFTAIMKRENGKKEIIKVYTHSRS
jgi:hypothetical protein